MIKEIVGGVMGIGLAAIPVIANAEGVYEEIPQETRTPITKNLSLEEVQQETNYGRTSDFVHPLVSMNLDGFEAVRTFDYPSQRPDSEGGQELGGVTHTYEILRKENEIIIREQGKNVMVSLNAFWDINQDGIRGAIEREAQKNGYLVDFSKGFADILYEEILSLGQESQIRESQSSGLESEVNSTTETQVSEQPYIAPTQAVQEEEPVVSAVEEPVNTREQTQTQRAYTTTEQAQTCSQERSQPSELEEESKTRSIAGSLGASVHQDQTRGLYIGPMAGASFEALYNNGITIGLGINAGVLFGENGKVLDQTQGEASTYEITPSTLTTQETSEIFKSAINFYAGANGFYGGLGVGIAVRNSTDEELVELTRGENVIGRDITYAHSTTITPELTAKLGYTHQKSGLGIEANGTIDLEGNWSAGANISFGRRGQDRREN